MTDERIDVLIRKMAISTDPEPGALASGAKAVLPRVRAAREEDRTWLGRIRRDARLIGGGKGLRDLIRARPVLSVAAPLVAAAAVLASVLALGATSSSPLPSPLPPVQPSLQPQASDGAIATPTPSVGLDTADRGTFVLSSMGRIVVVAGDGSGRRELTDGSVTDYFPIWSPDGRRIAYFSQRCTATPDCPSKSVGSELRVIDADGSNRRSLLGHLENPARPVWLPDSSAVVVTSYAGPQGSRVDRVGLDGTVTSVRSNPDDEKPVQVLSPDGSEMVYEADGIRIASSDGSHDRLLVPKSGHRMSIAGWTPDGHSIAYNVSRYVPLGTVTWIVNRDGSGAHVWSTLPEHGSLLGWSPDRRWMLVLVRGNDQGVGRHYVLADADGTHGRTLEPSDAGFDWTPDGQWLIGLVDFTTDSAGPASRVVVVDPSGTASTTQIEAPGLRGSDWRPGS